MPFYAEVNWDQAECRGVYTDLFYRVEEERNVNAYPYIDAVRSICAKCPIWEDCLTYAIRHEQYGVWGGLTSMERKSFEQPDKYPAQRSRALLALEQYGITLDQLKECYEHTIDVGGVADQITNN